MLCKLDDNEFLSQYQKKRINVKVGPKGCKNNFLVIIS